ncbi:MAG: hypothetical protein ABW022_14920 [Actinoplanes sp.]
MTDLDDPQAVAAELRRRGLPVYRAGEVMGSDDRLRELFGLARLRGWTPDRSPRAKHINRGRLLSELKAQA